LLTRPRVCEIFGIHERTLRRWEQRGLITAVRVGRTVRFRAEEIERLLAAETGR
jgi:excisionase family DNA binding protein